MRLNRFLHIVKILQADILRCDLLKHASAMAYVTLFSLVPSLAAVFSLIALFKPILGQDSVFLVQVRTFVLENLATGSGEQVIAHLESFLANLDVTKIGVTGFAGLLVTLVLLLRQIEIAFNLIWNVQKARNSITRFVYFWTFLTLGTLIVGLTVGVLSGFDLQRLNPFSGAARSNSLTGMRILVPYFSTMLFFFLLYKFVPNCFVPAKFAATGAGVASVLLTVASSFYTIAAPTFTNYRAIYGALAAVPLFLMWLYIIWLIAMFGALLTWRLEQGFGELQETSAVAEESTTATQKYRDLTVRSVLPYLVLSAIWRQFNKNESGSGLTGLQLTKTLEVPSEWLVECLCFLEENNYLVRKVDSSSSEIASGDALHSDFYLAHSLKGETIESLHSKFVAPTQIWFDRCKNTEASIEKQLAAVILRPKFSDESTKIFTVSG